ncbi:sensor histidine kinase [Paracoccus aminophilus]|uniref:histidine kinase n=1 Tax=Paracoccus aminophilus JCM 7686 TaxID=1367847 RepID=S5XUC9_PARAH|nr:sensor histidine kinase [Paracoccus aminophilus]AGT11084.1 two-component system, sensor histidine kinase TorS [Paracoccus aminophilus JCM 7686]
MKQGSSLGRRLFVAFLIIAGLPALTGLWGWILLADVARNQDALIKKTLPAIIDVRGFTEESSKVVAAAPEFAAVTREADRKQRAASLLGQVDALHLRLERNRNHSNLPPYALSRTVLDMRDSIGVLDVLVQRRITALGEQRMRLAAGLEAAAELSEIADTLVANSEMSTAAGVTSLYDFALRPGAVEDQMQALDKLIEVDLFQLGLMFELRAHAAELGMILSRMAAAETPAALALAEQDLKRRTDIIARRIRTIEDPVRAAHAKELLATIAPDGDARGGDLASVTARLLGINTRIATVEAAVRAAAAQMDREAAALADEIHANAAASGGKANETIRFARQLTTLGAIVSLLVSLGVLWFYVRGNILRRLGGLASTMARLEGGDTRDPIIPRGTDEIARMEAAVEVFRRQAIENRRLEEERGRHLDELSHHRNQLEGLVRAQTEELRGEVAAHAEARRRAEAADRAKSEFLAMMSHDLRTPMNGVLGMLRGLGRDHLTPRQRSYLRAAEVSGHGLMAILNDILYLPLVESGRLIETVSTFSLSELVRDLSYLMSPNAQEKGLTFAIDLPPDLPPALRGDVAKLRQILFNLVANAVKFTEQGEVLLRITQGPEEGGKIPFTLSVSDTGKGISEWARERIFEIFEQENAATARQYGGTGLGLAICRRFAEVMGGKLSVQSTLGQGSVFTLNVGFASGDPADLPRDVPEPQLALRPLFVLVVEDHPINRMVVETYLEAGGHRWQVAETGEAAVEAAATQSFDVILMDVNLPGLSGTEATRRIRALSDRAGAQVPVIGISAHVHHAEITENLAAGMTEVLPKPLTPQQLHAALEKIAPQTGAQSAILQHLLDDVGRDRTITIARLFLDRLDAELGEIETARARGRLEQLSRAAHQLKGAAGNLDLSALAAALHGLETGARAENPDAIDRALTRLHAIVPPLRAELETALGWLETEVLSPAVP